MRPELMPSVVSSISRKMGNHSTMVLNRLNGKLDKLPERQKRHLRKGSHSNVMIMFCGELPKFVLGILSLIFKRPVGDKFTELRFLTDVDKLVRECTQNPNG